ncbi:GntR family transcriptional regulator [Bacillus paranthracis]|uniref:GntR family transcriptional regulator n=1 Tax=Bacillus paranthracis TaxID=2026186 RepID=UPI000D6D893B|nr:GntR family transcriptional regulator [Bacillus paranthracis]PWN74099.1 GntR family transcriptional regulator [Bacillus cereus]PWN79872.1 GntR family transcriptional regulator [Bacillus cereus]UHJ48885.1 GntR family transcriptional regulator [Bacillus paranthracis]
MIAKDNRTPLYYQLMDIIVEQIETGNLQEHDKLPSERELCEIHDVSRTTVRQTMQELEKEGYIYKKHGKGSFVSPRVFNQSLVRFYSFTEEMKKFGKVPSSTVVSFSIIHCDKKISKIMNINNGEEVYQITRLRLADKEPMLFETSYIPVKFFPYLTKKELEETPMYEIFRTKYQVHITRAVESFKAIAAEKEHATWLQVEKNEPSLSLERIAYAKENIIEYTQTIARGDKFTYTVELQ